MTRDVARRLDDAVRAALGHEALNGATVRALRAPDDGTAAFLAIDPDGSVAGLAVVAPSDTFETPHLRLGLAIDPARRDPATLRALVGAAVEQVARGGGGRLVVWVLAATGADDAELAACGFTRRREQLQMRVALPLGERPRWPPEVWVRGFVPGVDEHAWLAVNNRAFHNHPDQGGWIEATLRQREREPWFDPAGFLLAFDDRGLAGFCWTKVHEPAGAEPRVGEIFVIGVDPDRQGTGLGRALTLAGLEHLFAVRHCPVGMLHVDAANTAALTLYRSLGFRAHRTDRAYERSVAPT